MRKSILFSTFFVLSRQQNLLTLAAAAAVVEGGQDGETLQQQEQEGAHNKNIHVSSLSDSPWKRLDDRPLPTWYDDAKFGVFVHWGVFSVPSFRNEWFWNHWQQHRQKEYTDFVQRTERPRFAYPEYAARFTADLYQPYDWAQIFAQAGAQYVVLTSKHHEGYCLWNSSSIPTTWNWNVMDVGPRRDVLGELSQAVKNTTSPHTGLPIEFGVYHSLYEWYNPLYVIDKKNNFTTDNFVTSKTLPELYDLVRRYRPSLIWSDGNWEASSAYWQAVPFLEWYGFDSPVAHKAVWNDRWGTDTSCQHGSFLTCRDRYQPGQLQQHKWENANTIDKTSWGWNRQATYKDYRTVKSIVDMLIETVAYGGNLLLNVGPAADGTIPPIFVDRLLGVGTWLQVNGPAIYATKPWQICQNENGTTSYYYTRKRDRLFLHVTEWPTLQELQLDCPVPTDDTTISMLGWDDQSLQWTRMQKEDASGSGLVVRLPALTPDQIPCSHAWVLVLTNIANLNSRTTTTTTTTTPTTPATSA